MLCARCGAETGTSGTCRFCTPTASSLGAADATHAAVDGPSNAPHLSPGEKFADRYTIIKLIGVGGMAVVYQAWDESLGAAIALKLIRLEGLAIAERQLLEDRFKRELRLARQVTHPNVVRIHDLGEVGGLLYLTMELVQGADLAAVLRHESRPSVPNALAMLREIVAGLAAAHAAGVVHRDLKPGNILVASDGRALITDFGIARSITSGTLHTLPGSILGTVEYLAPEQAEGKTADQRTDVYALGLVAYELFSGTRPFATREGGLADLVARLKTGAPALHPVNPDVPTDLARVVDRCLEPEPSARYQSAAELQTALNALGPDGRRILQQSIGGWTWKIAAASVLVSALVAGAWWTTRRGDAPVTPRPTTPVSVLVANFDNRAGDPVFRESVEQALAIALEGASFITSYSRRDALSLARQLRPGSELDEAAARLVATREGIRIVLGGAIEPEGGGFSIRVKAVDPAREQPVAQAEARASNKADVLAAIGTIASKLREALGDTTPSAQQNAETFTAASLEAVRSYTVAQELSRDSRNREAIEKYREAIAYDPKFGRAYSGWSASARALGRRSEAEEAWKMALSLMDRMSEREKLRTYGGHYIAVTRNYEKAIENYTLLVEKYPADTAGHSNLAIAHFYTRNFVKATDEGRRAVEIYPRSLKFRTNYALFLMYAGEFDQATSEASRVLADDSSQGLAYLPLAVGALAADKIDEAQGFYTRASTSQKGGPSLAAIGRSDIAILRGDFVEAARLLEQGIAADRQDGNSIGEAAKVVALAEAHVAAGHTRDAEQAFARALKFGDDDSIVVPTARAYLALNRPAETQRIAAELFRKLPSDSRAYGRLLDAEVALKQGDYRNAIVAAQDARRHADLWLARFVLGLSYFHAGQYLEALSEFEACAKRRGEAAALFLDDQPSFRYLAPLPYWLGRSQEALGQREAALAQYRKFVTLRSAATADPLVVDARRRLALAGTVSR